jgi:CheY-like chemotaxis protein
MSQLIQPEQTGAPVVLIIEDDPESVCLWQRYADQSGFRTISTGMGEEALRLAQRERPALVVLDILLPDIGGWEVLETLKANPATSDIPVLICSALEEKRSGLAREADGYLQKPVLYEDFLIALSNIGLEPQTVEVRPL